MDSEKSENSSEEVRLTEKRVTRRVIRRRRSADSEETDSEKNVEAASAPQPEVERAEQKQSAGASEAPAEDTSVEEKTVKRETRKKASAQPKEAPKTLKKISSLPKVKAPDIVVKKPSQEEKEKVKKESERLAAARQKKVESKYKLKVVGTMPERKPVTRNTEDDKSTSAAPTYQPKSAIRRKEIIEVRKIQRPAPGGGGGRMSRKRKLPPGKEGKKTEITVPKAAKRIVKMGEVLTVAELAKTMSIKVNQLISKLMSMGMMVNMNQNIDFETASLVASEFGFEVENVSMVAEDLLQKEEKEMDSKATDDLEPRAPVVTVMGHVDHGKTSLLDSIRKADVASGEAGGITQHIGAYTVKTESGRDITFIDTPGHAAFTSMRARGAQVTDIVILVIAGDDGVMPQTKEAVSHAQLAGVPIIVALNKKDVAGFDADRIKNQLTEFSLVPEEWGGDTIFVSVSAKTGEGVPELLEFVGLQTDILELKADPDRPAKGVIIEACLDKKRGIISTVLVQDGTLRDGNTLVAGMHQGKVRAMIDDKGRRVTEAGPSTAVEVIGMSGVAEAGDTFSVITDEKKAKQIAQMKYNQVRQKELAKTSKVSLDDLYNKISQGDVKELRIVVKADTAGSVEVLVKTLEDLTNPKVTVKAIMSAVGGVTDNDINLAAASGAIVVAFHVRPSAGVSKLAENLGVELRYYDVIYELTEDMTKAMEGLLSPKEVEKIMGHAEVRETFSVPKVGTIAGCMVTDGLISRNHQVRLIRENVPIYTGDIVSLKRFKDDAKEVKEGLECGISIQNYNDLKVGDIIETFKVEEVAGTLED